ncbi:hypothetical protein SLA2020_479040 [Shorea laevis]
MKAILEKTEKQRKGMNGSKLEVPEFMKKIGSGMKIEMVNLDEEDVSEWEKHGETILIGFERVLALFKWPNLFPEWIDKEEEIDGTTCPEIPMPDLEMYGSTSMDLIVTRLPCKFLEKGWVREVFRLQVHLLVSKLAVKKGKKDGNGRTEVVFLSKDGNGRCKLC